jgi:hypothetical protein
LHPARDDEFRRNFDCILPSDNNEHRDAKR